MFSQVSVCPGGGVCLTACWDAPPGQTPPCAVHAGIRSTSGRYASYWNAILLRMHFDGKLFVHVEANLRFRLLRFYQSCYKLMIHTILCTNVEVFTPLIVGSVTLLILESFYTVPVKLIKEVL